MEIAGYIAAIFVGISLGLIGGGGSILTVPIMVYLFSVDEVLATSYSLFVVGSSSAIGALTQARKKLVDAKTVLIFGLPTLVTVFLIRKFLLPGLPSILWENGSLVLTKNLAMLLLFSILMILAAIAMIRSGKSNQEEDLVGDRNYFLILLSGVLIGSLTGLVGAGGGFLLIPALVFFAKLPMKMAVGTSLSIIAINSFFGFMGDLGNYDFDWLLLGSVTALAVLGIFIGTKLSNYIPGKKLKPAFGWFVLLMGIYIIIKELFL
ncbi:MAG: sulfite exporter TauE/SafE family protein [Chitinophagales bacterium]|nr:sulfite exporter TauE/SafE family protein [Chitinophagales bacterium]